MPTNTLLIVADRGGLKAFRVEARPNGKPGLHQIDSDYEQDAHGRYEDKVTDRAGRFKGSGAGQTGGGSADHDKIDMENDRRAVKAIAGRINELIEKEKPADWRLAVPAQIDKLLTEHLKPEVRKHLAETVHADLLRAEAADIMGHFSALHTA